MENNRDLERMLRRRVQKGRLVNLAVVVGLLLLGGLLAILRENAKEIVIYDPSRPARHDVHYPVDLTFWMQFAFTLAFVALVMLGFSFLYGKIDAVQIGEDWITLYRGMDTVALYVNGELRVKLYYYLEAKLSDSSTVTVSMSRNLLSAHMTFSNGHRPIDL